MRKVKLTKESTKDILENLLKRSPNNYGKFEDAVADILTKVRAEGDAALFEYTKEFDKVEVTKETIRVTQEEIDEAYTLVDPSLIDVIRKALVNIRSFHEKQLQNINTNPVQCCYLLSKHGSVCCACEPAVLKLLFVIAADIHQCFFDHIDQGRIYQLVCFLDLLRGYTDRILCNFDFIKFSGKCK